MKTKAKKKALMLAVCHPTAVGGQAACARMLLSGFNEVEWHALSFPLPGQHHAPGRFLASVRILFSSWWICMTKKIEVVHVLTACGRAALFEKLVIVNVLRLTGVKTILNFQGAFDVYYSGFSGADQRLIRRLLRRVHVILLLHEDMKKFFTANEIASPEKIQVIPNAVSVYPPINRSASNDGICKILYLGWIIANKGLSELVQAACILAKNPAAGRFRMDVYGPAPDPSLVGLLQKNAREGGAGDNVRFHAPVLGEEKRNVFASATIFVFPSHMEGFPFVLLEAMEAGLPVISTDISPMNHIIQNGETGLLFVKADAADLAEKILLLLQDPEGRLRISHAARDHVVSNYSKDRILAMYAHLYSKL